MIRMTQPIRVFFSYFSFYTLLILVHGYLFGSNDQMDFMPYARHLQAPELYPHDFYIGCLSDKFNERWLMAHAIAWLPSRFWPVSFLMLHCLFTMILIKGLLQWVTHFIKDFYLPWLILFLTLILFYHRNLGGNEVYYNMFTPSLIAKAIAVWALWNAYTSNLILSSCLTVLATYIHPIVGYQIMILCFVLLPADRRFRFLLVSVAGASPYLFSLLKGLNESLSDMQFTHIMKLRNAHHFFPSVFGILNYILLVPLFILGMIRFYSLDRRIFYVLFFISAGCIVYSCLIVFLPKYTILSQWFKTTIWLKFFSVLAIMHWIREKWKKLNLSIWNSVLVFVTSLTVGLFVAYKIYRNLPLDYSLYQLPNRSYSKEVLFAMQVKNYSDRDAVFLVPPDYTAFKFYSERSTFVDWKAIPHHDACLITWYERIKLAYGLQDRSDLSLQELYETAHSYNSTLDEDRRQVLKAQGINYVIRLDKQQNKFELLKL